ncbi:MAG: hypothetical protein JWL81_1319 [Verrucomicrobiales bacterium]|nr:hypothetical protein [Verrucomicrobiales bacterium]
MALWGGRKIELIFLRLLGTARPIGLACGPLCVQGVARHGLHKAGHAGQEGQCDGFGIIRRVFKLMDEFPAKEASGRGQALSGGGTAGAVLRQIRSPPGGSGRDIAA